ncbi:MAG: hypothetical protein IJX85_03030 [Lachnospiraceae bacterium]|nr:hypothetical protein [Lachnospiraceae bacterium]
MNLKDKLTKKLLETGKKHRLLVYPTLALVAVITAISHAVYWGRGNGKRFVASTMIMALLISQSLFLTSSADVVTEEGDGTKTTEVVVDLSQIDTSTTEEVNIVDTSNIDENQTSYDVIDQNELDEIQNNSTEDNQETTEATIDDTQDPEGESTELTTEVDSTEQLAGEEQLNSQLNLLADGASDGSGETPVAHTIYIYRVDEDGRQQNPIACDWVDGYVDNGNGTVTITLPTTANVISATAAGQDVTFFSCKGIYASKDCTGVSVAGTTVTVDKIDNGVYSFYSKVTREKYPITINVKGQNVTDICQVPETRTEGDLYPAATYTVKPATDALYAGCEGGGAYAWGYNYNGISYNGSAYAVGDVVPVNPTGDNVTGVSMDANWVGQEIDVTYDFVSDTDTHIELKGELKEDVKTYLYDNTAIKPITRDNLVTTNPGYYLGGWVDATDSTLTFPADGTTIDASLLATRGDDITAEKNMIGRRLVGVWTYKDNTLVVSGTATAGDDSVSISGSYGDAIDCEISAKYKTDEKGLFGLVIPDSDIAKLNGYGLLVTPNQTDGVTTSYRINGTLNNVTDEAGITLGLTLTDYNKPTANQNYDKSITLVSNKKEVTLDPATIKHNNHDGAPSKPYDGNDNIKVNTTAQVTGKLGADDVYVTFDADATLDNANAGEGKAITLTGVTLDGTRAQMYTLTDTADGSTTVIVPNVATVTRIAVTVNSKLVEGYNDSILFGQKTPEYTVDLVNPNLLAPVDLVRYNACASQAEKEAFMKQIIGFTGTWDTTRTLYSPAGSYTITPLFSDEKVNYSVSASGVTSTFKVNRDSGEGNYALSPQPINSYYPNLTITASGGTYDKVRLIKDNSDIAEGANPSSVNGMFSSSVTLTDDMTNGTIMFQMLDVETGAITYPVTLTGINIDGTGPQLVSYSVSPNVKYFNEFGFGAYYHGQTIEGKYVESVDITFEYKTDDSACDELVYYFTDQDGNTLNSQFNGTLKLKKNAVSGNYVGTVTIGTGAAGQLVVYATDTTGNPSGQSKVKLTEAIDFIKESQSAGNYYEWMVENTINSADIMVTDLNGNGTTAGEWYNGLNFNVLAADSDSGVNKIIWSVTDPTGTVTSSTENAHDSVAMVISGEKNGSATDYGKLTTYDFNTSVSGSDALAGEYYVSAVLYDNAGNNVALETKGPYLFDGKAPVIACDDYETESDEYLSGVVFDFTVTEGVNESGVASVQLFYVSDGQELLVENWGAADSYSREITSNGTYRIVATDLAGNVSSKDVTFKGISDVIPNIPVISVDGKLGNDNWYIEEMPVVTIISEETTSDGVPVVTTYKLTVGGNQIQANVDSGEEVLNITSEGEVLIEAWSESKANCKSDVVSKTVKIDVNGPKIVITDSSVDQNGNTVIKFTVTDDISGANPKAVYVNDELVEVEEIDGVVTGSFVANENQTYSIVAEDIAGNTSDATEFVPLTLTASPIINITPTGAYLEARVYEGTNPISDCYIAYKKASASDYDTALSNKHDEEYGMSMNYTFRNLTANTVYDYRIYAIAANSNEVQVIEGSFRTADNTSTASVYGSVTYDDELPEDYKTYPVYVALYDANTVIAGVQLDGPENTDYIFKSVADGNYRIVATNGMLNEVGAVTVTNGGISYPEDYGSKGGIHFVLDGLSTDVVVEDNSINITADGLGKIYNTALYNGNVTDEDLEVVAAGGTVDITLYASYIDVNEIGQTTQSIFNDKIGKNGVIERYISLQVVKEVRDVDGKLVNGTPMNITRLAEPVSISFPLGDLSGQKIYVASVHGSGDKYTFVNWGTEDVSISQNYVTISTDRFSVYALYRLLEIKKEYTVKWVDGDGNIMKTETVVEGNSATPPTDTPKKAETDKYTYTFSGWDTDYKTISKDTIISAWFVANEKEVTPPTTEEPPTTEAPPSNDNKDDGKDDGKEEDITKEPTKYPYMGSGISPQTGDEAPIVILGMLMMISALGMIIINKKRKED